MSVSSATAAQARILHVTAELVFGGVESWLLNVVRLLRARGFAMDIAAAGEIDPRIRSKFEGLGVRVFACPGLYQPLRMVGNLRGILRRHGRYDLLHCHMHRGNGHAAAAGRLFGVPRIVVHSHLDTAGQESGQRGWKAWLSGLLQRTFADCGLACSQGAGDCLFDRRWRGRPNWQILHCGMDLARFERDVDRAAIRRQIGIPESAFVVGHVGRCEPVKNHRFILDLASQYVKSRDDVHFVLIGDGSLLPELMRRTRETGLEGRVRFLGARDDAPDLFLGAFDVFLLPSLAEGLPTTLLEAQAAGLPAVISDRISAEARVQPGIEVLSLDRPIEDWCVALDRTRGTRRDPPSAVVVMREAGFGIEESASALEQHYLRLLRI